MLSEETNASTSQSDQGPKVARRDQRAGTGRAARTSRPLSSTFRDRTQWGTLVILPLIGAIAFWGVQGVWTWAWGKISGPPGLTAYTPGANSCDPATLPLTLQAKTEHAIVVTGIKIETLPDAPPPEDDTGTVPEPEKCPGTVHKPLFDVDLSRYPVTVVPAARKADPDNTDFPFTVSADHPRQLNLRLARLEPGQPDARFAMKVEWVADGEYGSVTVSSDGGDSRSAS